MTQANAPLQTNNRFTKPALYASAMPYRVLILTLIFVSWIFFPTLSVVIYSAQDERPQQSKDNSSRRAINTSLDDQTLPREVRGYRIERADVRIRRTTDRTTTNERENTLVRLGTPRIATLAPLGVWLEVPLTIAAVEGRGQVDLLVFEDVRVDGTPVTVEEYAHPFRLPNELPLMLPQPARIYVSVPGALLGATNVLREMWPVTGRVYVCGRFRRLFFTFKRAVPVELNLSVRNPLYNGSAPTLKRNADAIPSLSF